MRLAQILNLLQNEPLLCSNDYRAVLLDLLRDHAELEPTEFRALRTGKASSGSELCVEQAEIRDGICIIPVGGPMAIGLGEFEKGAGAVDMDDITTELDNAEVDDEVDGIILNFDSPGGTVNGTWELCDRILAVEKPIYAFTRGMMCSAAYAAACATNGVFATKTATVGNIGVYTTFMDLSKLAQMAGITVKVFASGPIKGIATRGTALSAEQEMFMQQNIMRMAKMFFEHVRSTRGAISNEDMGGQFYQGQEAVQRGFLDDVMSDVGQLENFLRVR